MTTRERIIEATVDFFKQQANYERITLTKVAKRARIGKSTVYEHFRSKEDLVEETCSYMFESYERTLFEPLEIASFSGAFRKQVERILTVMRDARTIIDVLFSHEQGAMIPLDSQALEVRARAFKTRMDKRFEAIFSQGRTEGRFPKTKDPNARFVISAIISGLLYQYVNGEIALSEEQLLDLIERECVRVLQGK
ncbi:MAG: TetR/AcrR family transcriptional regulator [Acholeplasmataceae bacterium]